MFICFQHHSPSGIMKQLFLIAAMLICANSASAQQYMFGKTILTVSEIKARSIIEKLSQQVILIDLQKVALEEITSEYLDQMQEIKGTTNFEEKSQKLHSTRDKQAKVILISDTLLYEYQKCITEILTKQTRGHGRG